MGLRTARAGSVAWLEAPVAAIGKGVAWLSLAMVCLTVVIVLLRYGLNLGWIWLQESVIYLHAAVFLLAAGWTLQADGHVRVDIFYRDVSARHQAWVNLAGNTLLLAPVCVFLLVVSWEYVAASWRLLEGSREAGGIPAVFLLKSLILVFPALLLMQAMSDISRCWKVLRQGGGGRA